MLNLINYVLFFGFHHPRAGTVDSSHQHYSTLSSAWRSATSIATRFLAAVTPWRIAIKNLATAMKKVMKASAFQATAKLKIHYCTTSHGIH